MDIQYSKPRKRLSLRGAFNACVVVPVRGIGGVVSMLPPAGIIVNSGLMGEMPLDRLERDLMNAEPASSFKVEKRGIRGRGLTIIAQERSSYSPVKTVRYCDITFDSRAERNHYAKQIQNVSKGHNGLFLASYADIAGSVLRGALNLDFNPMMQRFDTARPEKTGFLSRAFGSSAEKEHKKMMRQHRKEMRRLGIKSAL